MDNQKIKIEFSLDLLSQYETASLENSRSLIVEAVLLLEHYYAPRAYFLAVAAIEEIGKSAIAFQGRGRNLQSPSVQRRLNIDFQTHSVKINSAFIALFSEVAETTKGDEWKSLIDYMIHLKNGREPSMYTDINSLGEVKSPMKVVRLVAAKDCVKLAKKCLEFTERRQVNQNPPKATAADDKLYTLGARALKVWEEENFGDFLLHTLKRDGADVSVIYKAVVTYHDAYLGKEKLFKS